MSLDRRDMLAGSQDPRIIDERKLTNQVDTANALLALMEMRGWKMLYEGFIAPRLNLNRFLQTTTPQQRDEVWGALRELQEMMDYINTRIESGKKATEVLTNQRGG